MDNGNKEILRMSGKTYHHEANIKKASALLLASYYKHCSQYPLQDASVGRECIIFNKYTSTAVIAQVLSEKVAVLDNSKTLSLRVDMTGVSFYRGNPHTGWFEDVNGIYVITNLFAYLHDNKTTIAGMLGLMDSDIQDIVQGA